MSLILKQQQITKGGFFSKGHRQTCQFRWRDRRGNCQQHCSIPLEMMLHVLSSDALNFIIEPWIWHSHTMAVVVDAIRWPGKNIMKFLIFLFGWEGCVVWGFREIGAIFNSFWLKFDKMESETDTNSRNISPKIKNLIKIGMQRKNMLKNLYEFS